MGSKHGVQTGKGAAADFPIPWENNPKLLFMLKGLPYSGKTNFCHFSYFYNFDKYRFFSHSVTIVF